MSTDAPKLSPLEKIKEDSDFLNGTIADQIAAEAGRIDAIVCNAGVCPPGKPVAESPDDEAQWARVIDINIQPFNTRTRKPVR